MKRHTVAVLVIALIVVCIAAMLGACNAIPLGITVAPLPKNVKQLVLTSGGKAPVNWNGEKLLFDSGAVVDGTLGSNSIEQAKIFNEAFGLTGLIVTKLDGTSRGGALVGIWRELRIPIYFVGLGEKPEDLQPFSVENYVSAVFGEA